MASKKVDEESCIYRTIAELIYANLDKYLPGENYNFQKEGIVIGELFLYFEIKITDNYEQIYDDCPNPEVVIESVQIYRHPENDNQLIDFIEIELFRIASIVEESIKREL